MESNAAHKLPEADASAPDSFYDSVDASYAVIEFSPDGTITRANANFCKALGYAEAEIVGRHHRLFVDLAETQSLEYRRFWDELAQGKEQTREFKRVTKAGRPIWIKASYMPVKDHGGKVVKVVKLAQDCTAERLTLTDLEGRVNAIGKVMAVIEFKLDGTIVAANDNFCAAMGYRAEEIVGQHHGMFVEDAYRRSADYKEFWARLNRGEFQQAEYKRVAKGGREVWISASYNPILDIDGKACKVVKFATDITAEKIRNADYQGQIAAIGKSQAVIEFNLDGTIITANDNFLNTLGYTLREIQGTHHENFCEEALRRSPEYKQFWQRLAAGEFQAGVFKRVAKGGREVWIQASYNPILDANGRPFKVVKYATDITKERMKSSDYEGQLAAIGKSQAVIEFNMDGTILGANANFLGTVGYSAQEVVGKHHSVFVDDATKKSAEYRLFWEKLNRGEYDAGQYRRIGKGNKEVWIQASYNPIMDMNGRPFKVVKYATDITDRIKLIQDLSEASQQLASASGELNAAATQMAASSREANGQASEAAGNADSVSRGVEAVATSTEEMQASIKEIARNANEASSMSNSTRNEAQATNETIKKLGDSSKEIGNVIKVISSIAQQTNLLALNATIEAARAGDAGRGFAVVANEVKELAKQTAKATEEITNKIGAIQSDSAEAVKAISGIGTSIDKLNAIAGAIAASVEEQAATTTEVARVVKDSNAGVQKITTNIRQVSTTSSQSSTGAAQVLESAKGLQDLAVRLSGMVKRIQQN